ncbi:hypothetical protein SK128_012635 [Halocaridina rubra]|uniref:Uncharacterized protein n=1 Tax=Halocaridina rubra TaxID=373956 RepID=A0AAN9AHC2_HALRR
MEEKATTKSNRRRRERALKMKAEISSSENAAKISEDSCEEALPLVRTKPPRPRKKSSRPKDPLFEEDVIEGFAFLAFKSYEDLEECPGGSFYCSGGTWRRLGNNGPRCHMPQLALREGLTRAEFAYSLPLLQRTHTVYGTHMEYSCARSVVILKLTPLVHSNKT